MIYPLKVSNAKRNVSGTITANVIFSDEPDRVYPFTASPADGADYGRKLYHDLDEGKYGDVAPVTDKDISAHWEIVNGAEKEKRLIEADRKINPMLGYAVSGILSDAEKETFRAWNEYRKALEGVGVTADDIDWPDKPQ